MKSFLKYLYSLCLRVLLLPFCVFSVRKNRLVFTGLTGGDGFEYSCNPRYISDYIREKYAGRFEIYWVVAKPGRYAAYEKDGVCFLQHFRLRSFYYLLTAKVIVTNGSYAPWFPFRKSQYLINTWHGGGAYKRIENDKPDANWATRKRAEFCAENISLFLSSCRMADEKLFRHAFLYKGEILACGMPRNDRLVRKETESGAKKVCSICQIPDKAKILLYAPTYREGGSEAAFDIRELLEVLEKNGETWYVLYRAHRYSKDVLKTFAKSGHVIDVSAYEDMQELLCAADMLVTDYSSCIWDYAFLERPCFLYTPDLQAYTKKNGFYVDIYKWPFPVCEDMESLKRAVREYDEEKNRRRIREHLRYMGSFESGHACEAVCERILEVCGEKQYGRKP